MFGCVGAFGPWGLDAHLARSPFLAAAGEGMAALQEKHHAAFAFEFAFILDGPAFEIRRRNAPAATRHRAFPHRREIEAGAETGFIALRFRDERNIGKHLLDRGDVVKARCQRVVVLGALEQWHARVVVAEHAAIDEGRLAIDFGMKATLVEVGVAGPRLGSYEDHA